MNVVYIVTASIIGTFILVLLLLFTLRRTQHFKRGLLYKQKGMIDDAIVEFEQAISSDPSNALAYWYLANLYEEKGLYGRAAELYQYMMDSQLIPMEVPFSEVHKRLAKCYFKAKRVQEAFIELKKLMMVEPEDPEPDLPLVPQGLPPRNMSKVDSIPAENRARPARAQPTEMTSLDLSSLPKYSRRRPLSL